MLENEEQYNNVRGQRNAAVKAAKEYRIKMKSDNSLNVKLQYDVFKGQAEELNKELIEYKEYQKFRKYLDKNDYDGAGLMSLCYPKFKENLSKEELVKLTNYYENSLKSFIHDSLKKANKDLKKMKNGLEKVLNELDKR